MCEIAPYSSVGPWEEYEYVVLSGHFVRVNRPKWHRTYKFADGGLFKFWALQDLRQAIIFREKVGYWLRYEGEELPWDIQDRICFMLKSGEKNEDLAKMDKDCLKVIAAADWQVAHWVDFHPYEPLLDRVNPESRPWGSKYVDYSGTGT